jgi:hypothetical protein
MGTFCISEICVKQYRINEGVGVENTNVDYLRIYVFPIVLLRFVYLT